MERLARFRPGFRRKATEDAIHSTNPTPVEASDKQNPQVNATEDGISAEHHGSPASDYEKDLVPTQDAQRGVQQVEAVALVWSKPYLVAVFITMWMLYLVNSLQSSILGSLVPFATSDFSSHSLLTAIYIVSNAMTAALYIPLAKILDLWGRAEGFAIMVLFATIGMIMMAASNGLATFCAAQVFYSVGFGGLIYTIDVVTADISKLKNRGLAYAFTSSPYMVTAFAGPKAAEGFYENLNWRWGFGAFAIILPFVAAPMFIILKVNLKKAEAQGRLVKESSGRTLIQSVLFYAQEFDLIGVILFAGGFTVFLLPFTLADSAPDGWATGYIIAMIVVGFVTLVLFGMWEFLFSKVPFLNVNLLVNRTVIGVCLLDLTYQISYYCWASYFTSFLQVVNNLTVAEAGYVSHTFDIVSGVLLIAVGFSIRKTGYYKWLLYFAVPIYVLGQGLMIHFRQPGQGIGYIVMCQIFIAIGGSIFIICQQIAILAASDHQHVAAILALLYVIGNIGGAIGNTISGAIWTNTFADALARLLPEESLPFLDDIYSDLETQLSYEVGDPTRIAIQAAYGYAQQRMLITGTAFIALAFVWILLIKNINVAKINQVKGTVF